MFRLLPPPLPLLQSCILFHPLFPFYSPTPITLSDNLKYRPTVRYLHRRLICIIWRRFSIGSTTFFSTNQNVYSIQSENARRSHKIGQVFRAYPSSISVSLLSNYWHNTPLSLPPKLHCNTFLLYPNCTISPHSLSHAPVLYIPTLHTHTHTQYTLTKTIY